MKTFSITAGDKRSPHQKNFTNSKKKKNPTPNSDHSLELEPGHLNEASGELGPAQAGREKCQATAQHYLSDTAAGNTLFLLSLTQSVAFLLPGFLIAATCYVLVKTGD